METKQSHSYFSMGKNTLAVPFALHHENRQKIIERMKALKVPEASFILLQGGESGYSHATDHEPLFRQESFFQYLFGVREPDCWGAIDIHNNKTILFIPFLAPEYAVWMGKILPPENYKQHYEVDGCYYTKDLTSVLQSLKASTLYVLKGQNTDSGTTMKPPHFEGMSSFKVDQDVLWEELCDCRAVKSQKEIEVLRYAAKVSSDAHKAVMASIKPGMYEYQMEATFLFEVYHNGGCRHTSYTCICASGANGAVLHYGHAAAPNEKKINDGEMVVFDMGAEYHCYGADITRSFPVNGKFTQSQKEVYEAVLAAQQAVMNDMKPGKFWSEMHLLANKVLLEHLITAGFLKGQIEDLMNNHIGATFMPHGLGHLLGIDTHDVGGYIKDAPTRSTLPGLKKLRTSRRLEEGMVITVEPGCYFIDSLLDTAKNDEKISHFFNWEKIDQFRKFGGVRIEDDVVVTKDGIENLTCAPVTVAEIEDWMAKNKK